MRTSLPLALSVAAALLAGTVQAGETLDRVTENGAMVVATNSGWPPQSYLDDSNQMVGFDIDVATEIATRLGVDVDWETPAWDVITAGSWNGRWDTTVGSMTPTNDRQEVLDFTEPYNYTPAVVVTLADDDSVSDLTTDLDGKKIGARATAPLLAEGGAGALETRWLLTLGLYDLVFGLLAYAIFDFLLEE